MYIYIYVYIYIYIYTYHNKTIRTRKLESDYPPMSMTSDHAMRVFPESATSKRQKEVGPADSQGAHVHLKSPPEKSMGSPWDSESTKSLRFQNQPLELQGSTLRLCRMAKRW